MRILITGGAGFIGRATARALAGRGHETVVLDVLSQQVHGTDAAFPEDLPSNARCIRGDVRDPRSMADALAGCDAVVHLAAETGTGQSMYEIARYCDVNVQGTATLLQALNDTPNQVRRILIASSRSVYGEGRYRCPSHGPLYPGARDPGRLASGRFDPACPHCGVDLEPDATPEDAPLDTASIYAATKLAQEKLVLAHAGARGLAAFALRYQNVWGEGQSLSNAYTGILSIFSSLILEDRPIEIFEDGEESRDFVHVDDVALANVLALEADVGGLHVLNVGSGVALSVNQVVAALGEAFGRQPAARISGRYRAGDIRHNFADLDRIRAVIPGFRPQPFADGLAGFADWVRGTQTGISDQQNRYGHSLVELERQGLMKQAGR